MNVRESISVSIDMDDDSTADLISDLEKVCKTYAINGNEYGVEHEDTEYLGAEDSEEEEE